MRDPETRDWLIKVGNAFYRTEEQGYTSAVSEAGRYTKEEANALARSEPMRLTAVHISEARPIGEVGALRDAVAALRAALVTARIWHEEADKAISKRPNANEGQNGWMRCEHQEQMAEISAALAEGCDSVAAAQSTSETTHG